MRVLDVVRAQQEIATARRITSSIGYARILNTAAVAYTFNVCTGYQPSRFPKTVAEPPSILDVLNAAFSQTRISRGLVNA